MPEILLHYIWSQGLFLTFPQFTTDGRSVEVVSVGQHNRDAGPDFSNVELILDGVRLVGNIEIHVTSSDWRKHHHHTDPAYDNILLHIVRQADEPIYNSKGESIPQCCLQYTQPKDYLTTFLSNAQHMDDLFRQVDCSKHLLQTPNLLTQGWRNALVHQRLKCKTESIHRLLEITHNDWTTAFYITLAHHFGFHTNGVPFEQLAISTPIQYLRKHRNSLFQLTALLLGQSGLLPLSKEQDAVALTKEYAFLRTKFLLQPLEPHIWKRLRLRPQNFPEVRIRQFAQLFYQSESLLSQLMDRSSIDEVVNLFRLRPPSQQEPSSVVLPPAMGVSSIHLLIINVVVPFLYAQGKTKEAIDMLWNLPAESNSIIRQWRELGQLVETAADSQALIHLFVSYCQPHQCINCEVAYQIFLPSNSLPSPF